MKDQSETQFAVLLATIAEVDRERTESGKLYREFLRVPAISAGLYVLPAGATDPQRPHHEDEMYYVIRGRARFHTGNDVDDPNSNVRDSNNDDREVSAGSVIFVAAEIEHRFYDVVEELAVLVFFAPAES